MSVARSSLSNLAAQQPSEVRSSSRRWIINSWFDFILFVWTPLYIIPLVLFLNSSSIGIPAETIGLIVVAFGALGHHLPGLIRAYGDRDLFQRFRLRFILAPAILFLVFFPLYRNHFEVMKLILTVWASWHGFMQIYGFVRIYDAKVGCISPVTAYWDWLMCLSWCSTAQIFSHEKMAGFLGYWYKSGGILIPPAFVHSFRWICLAASIAVLIGFLINHVAQVHRGPAPNFAKLMMLASGIGFWWFCMVGVGNIILGVALFEIFHDVQYLAIVWLYNCRRVNSNAKIGEFMKFVFRRGMVMLYLGLVLAYGVIGLVPHFATNEAIKTTFMGILWTSTILHYYYDGFIWKVREKTMQSGLGLDGGKTHINSAGIQGGLLHLVKWSPLILMLCGLFITDLFVSPSLPQNRIDELTQRYTQTLLGSSTLPDSLEERAWLYSEFEQLQNIASANQLDASSQLRAAIILANFGRNDEAVELLQQLVQRFPGSCEAHLTWGGIELYRANTARAAASLVAAQERASTDVERANVNVKLGELHLYQGDRNSAKACFDEAMRLRPSLSAPIEALYKSRAASSERR